MKTFKTLQSTIVAAALCAVSASLTPTLAQDASNTKDQTLVPQTSASTQTPNQTNVIGSPDKFVGTKVQNQQGERLGRITDVGVATDSQSVSYCVLKVKPGIFARTRYVQVPMAAFQPSPDGTYLILNASKANLANARGFDPSEGPAAAAAWGAEIPPTTLPPAEVYGGRTSRGEIYPPSCDSSADWDQFHYARNANDAINQSQFDMNYGYFLNSH